MWEVGIWFRLAGLLGLFLALKCLKGFDFLLFFGLIATLIFQSVRDDALHDALRGHLVAGIDQLKDGSRLGNGIWIDLAILKRNGCASMTDNIDFEVLKQLFSDTVGSSDYYLIDKLGEKRSFKMR